MKIRNIVVILCVLVTLLLTLSTISNATVNPDDYKPNNIYSGDAKDAIDLGKKIIGGITVLGTIVAVVGTMVLGIKYMVGSIEERAEYKKSMMPMLIGMILIFGVSWIIRLIYNIVSNVNI